jgi:iron complex outermembrane receptor protein
LIKPPLRLLGVALAVHAAFAQAQTANNSTVALTSGNEPPQAIVSGSRFSEPLQSGSPVGTTVITAEEIERSGAITVYDALRRLGGVQTRNNLAGTRDETIDLRGFGITGDQNTLVLVDGVRISENELQPARLSSVPLNNIERIEILRGSGAVLYGGGATGGVINVITKGAKAGSKSLNLGYLVGSYNTSELRADGGVASGPLSMLGGASLSADIAANRYDSNNYRQHNAVTQENFSTRLRVTGERGEVGVSLASERARTELPGALSSTAYQTSPRGASTPNDRAATDASRYTLFGNYRFQYVELAADVWRRDKVDRFFNDYGTGSGTNYTRSGSVADGFSPRMRITAPVFGLKNALVVGYDTARWRYNNQQAYLFSGVASEGDLGNTNLSTNEYGTQRNEAVYFKEDLQVGDVRISGGARRETLKQTVQSLLASPVVPMTNNDRKLHAEELGVAWNFLPAWTVHARAANSYRIANVDETRFLFPRPGFLLPQTSRDFETGVAYASRTLDVDLRVYESRLDNELLFVPKAIYPPNGANINLAPTERNGVELTVKWRPRADLDFTGFVAQSRARFRKGSFGGADLTGREVPLAPRTRASLQANWRITPVDAVNLGYQYVGSQVFDNDQANTFGQRIPDYSTVDFKYTRRIANVDLSVMVRNLFNRGYYAYGVIGSTGNYNVYPEARRAFYVSAAAHF